jgi:hypothetical protein
VERRSPFTFFREGFVVTSHLMKVKLGPKGFDSTMMISSDEYGATTRSKLTLHLFGSVCAKTKRGFHKSSITLQYCHVSCCVSHNSGGVGGAGNVATYYYSFDSNRNPLYTVPVESSYCILHACVFGMKHLHISISINIIRQ